ncbi:hypothetical protein CHS0354_003578 [Potamilus streckersoni]|uniref:protein-tyrosine-phosphatase n=1 Tax=Potamilus streckersoni TaxID=2493646 RepID=A0AAE0SN97_9BIVA|nr:hypothetical protein CHS0354_003578 [Potamilus streckersoni]
MKMGLTMLLICAVILHSGTSDSTCLRGGYRNEQLQFGPGCMYKCNCKNMSEQCDNVSGKCTSGCADSWMGPGCQYGDVAFNKPATQTLPGNPAMNNNLSSVVDGNYSTCSNISNGIWLEVDLQKNYQITGLIITMDKIYEYETFQVEIKNRSLESRFCVSDGHLKLTNGELQITCNDAIYGSIVRIVLIDSPEQMMLCDVRVFDGRNLAYGRNAIQSTNRFQFGNKTDGWAELAVDGGTSPEFFDRSCTHTDTQSALAQWWKVDLNSVFFIKRIQIVNRNMNQERLKGFTIAFEVRSVNQTVYYDTSNENPAPVVEVAEFLSYTGESVYIRTKGGQNNPLTLCEVFIFADCPVYQCGWKCEKYCYCNSSVSGYNKIDGTCPVGECVKNWAGINGRCDYCLVDDGMKCPQQCSSCSNGSFCFPEHSTCLKICDVQHWGLNCSKNCGKCVKGDKCNQITGTCPGQCEVEWWGDSCTSRCSSCKNSTKCDKNNGQCEICEDGRWGSRCDKTCGNCIYGTCTITEGECIDGCKNGSWGTFCNESCGYCMINTMCQQESGVCSQCPAGKWGQLCNRSCEYCAMGTQCDIDSGNCLQCKAGNWSLNCALQCGQCSDDGACDINTSNCIHGCLPGWYGDNCTTECSDGWYGHKCSSSCGHCQENITCNKGNGKCPDKCSEDFLPPYCQKRKAEAITPEEEDARKGVTIGASIGAFIAACLVIVVVVFLVKRQRRENQAKSKLLETSMQQSEDDRNIVYANIARSHEEQKDTTANLTYEVVNINLSSSNISADRVREEEKYRVDNDEDDAVQSNSSVKDIYYNEIGLNNARIPLADLPHYFRKKAYDSKDLENEFEKLPKTPQSSMTIAQMPENAKKNRYKGICAYDDTRVELPTIEGISGSDYINACFIRGFERDRTYIASQGPTEKIMDDFWRMIWHCGVDKIVMLTELVEGGKIKCTQYWPVEGKCIYGSTDVEYLTEDVFADYTIRKLKIQKLRIVTQFHFTAWPDRGVPETPSSLVQFWSKVRNTVGNPDMPIVVHCSAGVGRTGTFIALDYLYEEGKQTGSVNIFACIHELRQQRVNMVQTKEQYVYLHEAVIEALMPSMASVPSITFHEKYQNLFNPERKNGKCPLQIDFEQMLMKEENPLQRHNNLEGQEEEPRNDFTDATLTENRSKNRYDDIVPASRYRPILLKYQESDNDYINAVILPSHKSKNAFLLTQTPLPNTVVDFLRLVLDNEVNTIVMFDDEITTEERVGMYWPLTGGHAIYGQVEVDVKSTGHMDTHKHRLLNLTRVQTGEVLTVMQFICTFWKRIDCAPPNCTQFLAFMEAIENWQRKNKRGPTVVHCLNGSERSGLYCVVSTILERLKIDREVAISSVIRQMRIRRPQIVPNYEQFKFCHDVVAEFLNRFEAYSNFSDI